MVGLDHLDLVDRDPEAVTQVRHARDALASRRGRTRWLGAEDPVFASRVGTWLWPNNVRTRLRQAVVGVPGLDGTTPHALRRTVGTLVAHEVGLDAARNSRATPTRASPTSTTLRPAPSRPTCAPYWTASSSPTSRLRFGTRHADGGASGFHRSIPEIGAWATGDGTTIGRVPHATEGVV